MCDFSNEPDIGYTVPDLPVEDIHALDDGQNGALPKEWGWGMKCSLKSGFLG